MKERVIEMKVNGETYRLIVKAKDTLGEVLRNGLGLKGTKIGCGTGTCGACTVLVEGEPTLSCLTLAVRMDGRSVITIEGLAKGGRLDPMQEAFIESGAVQCGFCSPGMILSAKALLERNRDPKEDEIRKALVGNICRCTGYVKIVEAIKAAVKIKT
ncbi:MAG: (2Fe-2S)-binding protein [Candidatus Jordarchaeaceae archaeon]